MSIPSLQLAILPVTLRMKTLLQLTCALLLLSAHVSPAMAWQVLITNNCTEDAKVDVYGNHLFWNENHCANLTVPRGGQVVCKLPDGICPIHIAFASAEFLRSFSGILPFPLCWDQVAKIAPRDTSSGNSSCQIVDPPH